MKPSHIAYIALGSNKGTKFDNLNQAILGIHQQVGTVRAISKVYETKAQGFEGDAFLNACISVKTQLKPAKLLKTLLAIEKELGRTRKTTEGYQSRTIDLDILLYEEEVLETDALTLPHPRLQERNFVLQPLVDIAPDVTLPVLKQTVQ